MLKNTFRHMPGVGPKSEQQLWAEGITSWEDLIESTPTRFSARRRDVLLQSAEESLRHLQARNPAYFSGKLPSSQQWRFFPDFRDKTAYLDIETDGLDSRYGSITTLALYDGQTIRHYVQGKNLRQFVEDITRYDVLITYNGRCFDVPFIERYFKIRLEQAHIDLRYILSSLGYKGGLKRCEQQLGIGRGEVEGLDGAWAPVLWNEYQRGNQGALETLLAYNIEDVVNLEALMVIAYNLNLEQTPFTAARMDGPVRPENPFSVDRKTVERLRRVVGYFGFGRGWG